MDTTKITKLAQIRRKIDASIKEREAALKESLKDAKEKRDKIDAALGKVINKSQAEGTMKSFTLPEGYLVYASEVDKYSTKDRTELDKWVLEPLLLYMDIEADLLGDEAAEQLSDLAAALVQVQDRLGIFSNTLVKDSVIAYRKDTGGSEVEGDLTGGKLPAGTGMYKERKVNYRKV